MCVCVHARFYFISFYACSSFQFHFCLPQEEKKNISLTNSILFHAFTSFFHIRFVREKKKRGTTTIIRPLAMLRFGSIDFHTRIYRKCACLENASSMLMPFSTLCVHRYFIFCYLNMEKDHLSNSIVSNFTQFQR